MKPNLNENRKVPASVLQSRIRYAPKLFVVESDSEMYEAVQCVGGKGGGKTELTPALPVLIHMSLVILQSIHTVQGE